MILLSSFSGLLIQKAHSSIRKPATSIECINEEVESSCRTRDWRNTCILDIRPFRSDVNRKRDALPGERDNQAYDATREIFHIFQPDVLLLCQSGTRSNPNEFARSLSSSIGEYGKIFLYRLGNGKQVVVICCFNPMYVKRYAIDEDRIIVRIRQAALRFTFLQAVNIFNRRVFRGPGVQKLRDAVYGASRSPHTLLPNGTLDPSLDDRFKGFTLAPNATPEFMQWQKMMSEKSEEVSLAIATQ